MQDNSKEKDRKKLKLINQKRLQPQENHFNQLDKIHNEAHNTAKQEEYDQTKNVYFVSLFISRNNNLASNLTTALPIFFCHMARITLIFSEYKYQNNANKHRTCNPCNYKQ